MEKKAVLGLSCGNLCQNESLIYICISLISGDNIRKMAKRRKIGFFKKALLAGALGIAGAAGAYFASNNVRYETNAYIKQKINSALEMKSAEVRLGLPEEGDCTSEGTSHAYLGFAGHPALCYKVALPAEILKDYTVKIDGRLATKGRMERSKSGMELIINSATGEKRRQFPPTTGELPFSYYSKFSTKGMGKGLHTIELNMEGINGEMIEDRAYWRIK